MHSESLRAQQLTRSGVQAVAADISDEAELTQASTGVDVTLLSESGCNADIPALRRAHPQIGWQTFAEWMRQIRT